MTKMVIFRLETVLLWSHNKHKHFWRRPPRLPAADHDGRDSRRRVSCIQYKKKMPSAAASRPGITGMRRNTSFLECTLAQMSSLLVRLQRTHTWRGCERRGHRRPLHRTSNTQTVTGRRNPAAEIWPHKICSRGQSFSASEFFIFFYFLPCPHTGWEKVADSTARGVNPVVLWLP